MEKKPARFSLFFKRLNNKGSGGGVGGSSRIGRWKAKSSSGLRWNRKFNFRNWLVDTLLFRIASACEAVVLAAQLCFFYLCCGCRF